MSANQAATNASSTNCERPSNDGANACSLKLLVFGLALLCLATAFHVWIGYRWQTGLGYASGAWATAAWDVAEGLIYRPPISDIGYGGTRYMPLYFVLHGLLVKTGVDPATAGFALALVCTAAFMAGVYFLLRWSGVGFFLAGAGALLMLLSAAVQLALITVRGDMLAAALNIWGLALCVKLLATPEGRSTRSLLLGAAVLFTLAFSTKLTTVFGVVAACLAFALAGRKRDAFSLALLTMCAVLLSLTIIQLASGGRALTTFLACGSGGANLGGLLKAPYEYLSIVLRDDIWSFFILLLAAAGWFAVSSSQRRELLSIALPITAFVLILLFGSPGVDFNHLIDLHAIAILFLLVQFNRKELPLSFGVACIGVVTLLGSLHMFIGFYKEYQAAEYHAEQIARAEISSDPNRPLLAENPWVPILKNERPYMLDCFMFRLTSRKNPAIADDLLKKLENRYFRAVVLDTDPITPWGADHLRSIKFCPGFAETLLKNYNLTTRIDRDGRFGYYVLHPRSTSSHTEKR